MCSCQTSMWFQNGQAYINNNQNNQDATWHTIDFLITNNHCGLNNRVSLQSIVDYLRTVGINLSISQFQQTILGNLKRDGIVATLVYPGSQGGVFIPCNQNDIRTVAKQFLDRISAETDNLEGMIQHTSFNNLSQLLVRIRQQITTLGNNY